eukprot:CAMPEP_0195622924 /NCGR_PEP_ID=MMETSP0815-20121206/16473_1 /TAXON_ID=97485 /ORGANISM="Prymnesium parvum, Strain Texoma1" /LENGTH=301 /DNA_ID=CAMNT_0040763755 /DNA_START=346 /DNA_END=1247 /DNA_ORIENTATION=-
MAMETVPTPPHTTTSRLAGSELYLGTPRLQFDLPVVRQPANVLSARAHVGDELLHVKQVARAVVLHAFLVGLGVEDQSGEALGDEAGHVVDSGVDLRNDELVVRRELVRQLRVDWRELAAVAARRRVELHEHILALIKDDPLERSAYQLDHARRLRALSLLARAQVLLHLALLHAAHERHQTIGAQLAASELCGVGEGVDHGDRQRETALACGVEVFGRLGVAVHVDSRHDHLSAQLPRRVLERRHERRGVGLVEDEQMERRLRLEERFLRLRRVRHHKRQRLHAEEALDPPDAQRRPQRR